MSFIPVTKGKKAFNKKIKPKEKNKTYQRVKKNSIYKNYWWDLSTCNSRSMYTL